MHQITKKDAAELSVEGWHNPEELGLLKPDSLMYQDTEIQLRRLLADCLTQVPQTLAL